MSEHGLSRNKKLISFSTQENAAFFGGYLEDVARRRGVSQSHIIQDALCVFMPQDSYTPDEFRSKAIELMRQRYPDLRALSEVQGG